MKAIASLNPEMFSTFGQGIVLVWGLAYLAAGYSDAEAPIWWVFALEKARAGVFPFSSSRHAVGRPPTSTAGSGG